MKVQWRFLAPGAASCAGICGIGAAALGPGGEPPPWTPTHAPAFHRVDLAGASWSLADLRGFPVVLNVWSTWCGPCTSELPTLEDAPEAYPDVLFLGVLYADDPERVRASVASGGRTRPFPTLVDPDGTLARDLAVGGVPETLFVSADGAIVARHTGPLVPRTLDACVALAQAPGNLAAGSVCGR